MPTKPNILFFFMDDQHYNTIHALGNNQIITPNMDKLVSTGTTFTHAHIPSGTSAAVCMPSRAMLLTGRTLFHLENEGQQIPENHSTMGEALKKAGYRTYGSGKWHNGTSSFARSFTDGASIFFGGMWDHWNVPCSDYDPSGEYNNQINYTMNFMLNNQPNKIHCDRFSSGKHSTEVISDDAITFLNDYSSDQPFFAYLSFLAPHDPRSMPKHFLDMYNPDDIVIPDNFAEEHPFNYGARDIRDELLAPYPRTPSIVRKHIAEYYAMITHLDYEIGRVMEALKKNGQDKNTILVLAGDNGLAVGQHGLMGKQNHYEHSIRVPLIFSGPGIPKNLKLSQYVYLLDIFPTLCSMIDIDVPESVEGKNLVPIIRNPEIILRDTLFFAYNDLIRSVKNSNYKLIEYAGNIRYTQLFDLQKDPMELNNLYGDSDYDEIAADLRKELFRYRDEWDDRTHPMGEKFWTCYEHI